LDGPYNEHLVRDVGGLYLSLLVVSAWTLRRPELRRVTGAAWLIFSIPHLIYHASHPHMYGAADKIGNVVALAGMALIATALLAGRRSTGIG
jgi:hypothetical protein